MKKSTIGIGLLVAMVFTKAFLVDYENENNSHISREDTDMSALDYVNEFRVTHQQLTSTSITVTSLVSDLSAPVFTAFYKEDNVTPRTRSSRNFDHGHLIAEVDNESLLTDDVIPMDNVSNTGYGLWKTSTEEIRSRDERKGTVPLDGGNTISDNISRLFPRVP